MKSPLAWSYRPYNPPTREYGGIYICRLAPNETSVHVEWLDAECASYTVFYRKRGSENGFTSFETKECFCDIEGLANDTDYELRVTSGEKHSRTRLFRAARPEGVVVNYLHPDDEAYAFSGRYLCSPSIVRHPDGHLLASMDVYEANEPQNLSIIFRSDDDGESWHYVCELFPCFWGGMFIHGGKLYMLGCSTEYGDLLIGCSEDGGYTFSNPTVLFRGACHSKWQGIHKNPQPPLAYGGRMWFTMDWGSWAKGGHAVLVGSFPLDADPMDASSWRFSEPLPYDRNWEGVAVGPSGGSLEGTLTVFPDGKLYEVTRYSMGAEAKPNYGLALCYRVNTDEPEAPLTYERSIWLGLSPAKFMIHYDAVSGYYYTVICRVTDEELYTQYGDRRLLSLMKSKDCVHWSLVTDLIDHRHEHPREVGFQYPCFFFEGDDILLLCRTAMNQAHNHHDANYSTFHRIKNFRSL